MKIMVSGSAGFIFGNFVRRTIFARKDIRIVGIDKIVNPSSLNNVYVNGNNKLLHIGDIADEHFVDTIFNLERPDVVVNGAGETFVDASIETPNKFIHSNVMGTQVMVNASVKYGVKKFIQVSTDEVNGQLENENDPLWKEDAPFNPRNPYSASKACAELIVKAAGYTHGLNYNITRSCNNYGPWQTSEKFIPKVIQCILTDQKIPIYGEGKQIRDWMHVYDNCNAVLKIIDEGKSNDTYNISANQEFSNIEVVNAICNIMEKGHNLISFVKDRPAHDFRYGIDSSKMRSLGWAPEFKFKQGIAETVKWYQANKYLLQKQ